MNNPLIVLPVIIQLATVIILIFLWGKTAIQKALSLVAGVVNLGVAIWLFRLVWDDGIHFMNGGGWKAPFGITFVADVFSTVMVLLTAVCGIAVTYYAAGSIRNKLARFGFYPILHFLLMGLNGAFLTGDI